MDFNIMVGGATLIAFILAIVEYLGKFGVSGKAQLASSLIIGIVLGFSWMVADAGMPVDFAGWFIYVTYGLALGLTASGVYDVVNQKAKH